MARSKTAFPYTHKAMVAEFNRDAAVFDSEKPDGGLRRKEQAAIEEAIDIFDDLSDPDDDGGLLIGYLPPVYEAKYTLSFRKQFVDNFRNLGKRIRSGDRFYLRSVADELAFYAIVEDAKASLERAGENTDNLETFFEDLNQDTDFLMLYAASLDGIQDDAHLSGKLGLANLQFAEWFIWFVNVS